MEIFLERDRALTSGPARVAGTRAWLLVALLTALNILNFVDRQLIQSLAPLIMADLRLTRADIGLLAGFTFIVFYTVMGVGLGLAADRWSRRSVIAGGLGLWSGVTALSGAARGFFQLAVARAFVGIGEATLTPAALSMLGDSVPRNRLGLASSVYYTGLPLGTALSLAVAGWVAPRFGWRACFYGLGVVGLLAVPLLVAIREPARRPPPLAARASPSLRTLAIDALGSVVARPALAFTVLGSVFLAYGSAAAVHLITWLVDERQLPFSTATFTASGMAVAGGLLGNVGSGLLSDWCARRSPGGRGWSLVLMTIFFVAFSLGFYTLPATSPAFYACWFLSAAAAMGYFGPMLAAVQELSPSHTRSTTMAFCLLVMNVGGVGPGAWLTGFIGDRVSLSAGLLFSLAVAAFATIPFALAARSARFARREA
jgi:predicted MFS family arabinose efflux permease